MLRVKSLKSIVAVEEYDFLNGFNLLRIDFLLPFRSLGRNIRQISGCAS